MMRMEENGGDEAPADDKKTYGEVLKITTKKPTRDGYAFAGWTDETGKWYSPESYYTADQDGGTVTFKAK